MPRYKGSKFNGETGSAQTPKFKLRSYVRQNAFTSDTVHREHERGCSEFRSWPFGGRGGGGRPRKPKKKRVAVLSDDLSYDYV